MYSMDYENIPTAAEAERDAPTEAEIARAIETQGPAPVSAEDFLPASMVEILDRPFPS